MLRLSYETLKNQGFDQYLLEDAPERVLQFGDGNFLRAFVDHFIDRMNETAGFDGKVVVVQPAAPKLNPKLNQQDGLYTLLLRGREGGQPVSYRRVISCVSRCLNANEQWDALLECAENPQLRFLVSNTTEAGIVFDPDCKKDDAPPKSFPGKLTLFLYRRYRLGLAGFVILPCELIHKNGAALKQCILQYADLWGLEPEFCTWLEKENTFCNTLVDRIVTGYPREEADALCQQWGYEDQMIDTAEVFGAWIIEGPDSLSEELPFAAAGLPVTMVKDCALYEQRKVRILNGAHTSMVLGAYLCGQNIVRGCMEDETIRGFMNKTIYEEIIPTLDLPASQLTDFAAAVAQRFNNPYIDHSLLAIALNSTAKWKTRVMPSLLEYVKRRESLPRCLTFSFAAYVAFYHNAKERGDGCLIGYRGGEPYQVKDDDWVMDFYYSHKDDDPLELFHAVVNNHSMWGDALSSLPGFEEAALAAFLRMESAGMAQAMKECL